MRRTLGTIALLLAAPLSLAGCGDDTTASAPASDPAPDDTPGTPVACDDGGDCATETVIVSATGGGGSVTTEATELPDAAAVLAYVQQFNDSFAADVRAAIEDVGVLDGTTVVAAVVSIGCDVAPGVDVTRADDGGIRMEAHRVSNPTPECYAPVTTVALAGVPAG